MEPQTESNIEIEDNVSVIRIYKHDLDAVCRKIIEVTETEEEAKAIVQLLTETDWKPFIDEKNLRREANNNRLVACKGCKEKFKLSELKFMYRPWAIGNYCSTCFDRLMRDHTYPCPLCKKDYLSRQIHKACSECFIKDEAEQNLVLQRHLRAARKAGLEVSLTLAVVC